MHVVDFWVGFFAMRDENKKEKVFSFTSSNVIGEKKGFELTNRASYLIGFIWLNKEKVKDLFTGSIFFT